MQLKMLFLLDGIDELWTYLHLKCLNRKAESTPNINHFINIGHLEQNTICAIKIFMRVRGDDTLCTYLSRAYKQFLPLGIPYFYIFFFNELPPTQSEVLGQFYHAFNCKILARFVMLLGQPWLLFQKLLLCKYLLKGHPDTCCLVIKYLVFHGFFLLICVSSEYSTCPQLQWTMTRCHSNGFGHNFAHE